MIAAVVTALGWLVAYYFSKKKEDRNRLLESNRMRYEKKIEELYGPIFSLIHQLHNFNNIQHSIINATSSNGQSLTEEEINKIQSYFTESHFLPLHAELNQILKEKLYLIQEAEVPSCLFEYLKHSNQLLAQKGLWEATGIDTSFLKGTNYPEEFFDYIKNGMNSNMVKYESCIRSLEQGK